jgi:hypothetical protein
LKINNNVSIRYGTAHPNNFPSQPKLQKTISAIDNNISTVTHETLIIIYFLPRFNNLISASNEEYEDVKTEIPIVNTIYGKIATF